MFLSVIRRDIHFVSVRLLQFKFQVKEKIHLCLRGLGSNGIMQPEFYFQVKLESAGSIRQLSQRLLNLTLNLEGIIVTYLLSYKWLLTLVALNHLLTIGIRHELQSDFCNIHLQSISASEIFSNRKRARPTEDVSYLDQSDR